MTTLQIESEIHLDFDKILNGFTRLNTPELEHVFDEVNKLLAQRKAPHLSKTEFDLLQAINQAVPPTIQRRYQELTNKLQAEIISSTEHQELLELIERMEDMNVRRTENLSKLAQIRQTPVPNLMKQLGIIPPPVVEPL